jgi:eukaryotic translation initiation factor 2C
MVETIHLTHKRSFKCKRLTRLSAAEEMFDHDGVMVSVANYYAQKYKPLKYPNLPCLDGGTTKRPNYVPMEVSTVRAISLLLPT